MSFLEHKIPPPVVGLLCAGAMWWLGKHTPALSLPGGVRTGVAIAFLAAGLLVMLAGVISFRRAKTTVNPLKPETATALVTNGIFQYTRNPMYLGMLLVLIAWAVFLSSPVALTVALAFWLYIGRFQIRPEEAALVGLFGSAFTDYANRVRRWL
jgi:protein-S-isoprenylcysteine O-methyltransferase Ste14